MLRIAVVGAGIAGLSAAIALQKRENIDVQIYEKASRLQEIGASIALGPNGMRTLERLGVVEALDDSIAFRNKSGFPMIYRHWKTNEIVSVDEHYGEVEYRHQTSRFYRVHLQQALASHVDDSRLHLDKAFKSVCPSEDNGSLTISFDDGSTAEAETLLGADGIRSAVRQYFVPSSAPKWTGWVAFRSVFDAELVKNIPGALDEAYHWWGHDRTFFSSRLSKDLFTIVGGYHSNPDTEDAPYSTATWNSEGDVEEVKDYYRKWNPMVQQMVAAAPYVRQYPNTFASSLDTWVHGCGRVTFAGDAAHAHGGAFAAGGSLAADDAYAFALAIAHMFPFGSLKPSSESIEQALELYESTRKAHTDRVLSAVQQGNKKTTERLGKTETDEELRARMMNRSNPYWIHEHDVEAAFAQAVAEHGVKAVESRPRL